MAHQQQHSGLQRRRGLIGRRHHAIMFGILFVTLIVTVAILFLSPVLDLGAGCGVTASSISPSSPSSSFSLSDHNPETATRTMKTATLLLVSQSDSSSISQSITATVSLSVHSNTDRTITQTQSGDATLTQSASTMSAEGATDSKSLVVSVTGMPTASLTSMAVPRTPSNTDVQTASTSPSAFTESASRSVVLTETNTQSETAVLTLSSVSAPTPSLILTDTKSALDTATFVRSASSTLTLSAVASVSKTRVDSASTSNSRGTRTMGWSETLTHALTVSKGTDAITQSVSLTLSLAQSVGTLSSSRATQSSTISFFPTATLSKTLSVSRKTRSLSPTETRTISQRTASISATATQPISLRPTAPCGLSAVSYLVYFNPSCSLLKLLTAEDDALAMERGEPMVGYRIVDRGDGVPPTSPSSSVTDAVSASPYTHQISDLFSRSAFEGRCASGRLPYSAINWLRPLSSGLPSAAAIALATGSNTTAFAINHLFYKNSMRVVASSTATVTRTVLVSSTTTAAAATSPSSSSSSSSGNGVRYQPKASEAMGTITASVLHIPRPQQQQQGQQVPSSYRNITVVSYVASRIKRIGNANNNNGAYEAVPSSIASLPSCVYAQEEEGNANANSKKNFFNSYEDGPSDASSYSAAVSPPAFSAEHVGAFAFLTFRPRYWAKERQALQEAMLARQHDATRPMGTEGSSSRPSSGGGNMRSGGGEESGVEGGVDAPPNLILKGNYDGNQPAARYFAVQVDENATTDVTAEETAGVTTTPPDTAATSMTGMTASPLTSLSSTTAAAATTARASSTTVLTTTAVRPSSPPTTLPPPTTSRSSNAPSSSSPAPSSPPMLTTTVPASTAPPSPPPPSTTTTPSSSSPSQHALGVFFSLPIRSNSNINLFYNTNDTTLTAAASASQQQQGVGGGGGGDDLRRLKAQNTSLFANSRITSIENRQEQFEDGGRLWLRFLDLVVDTSIVQSVVGSLKRLDAANRLNSKNLPPLTTEAANWGFNAEEEQKLMMQGQSPSSPSSYVSPFTAAQRRLLAMVHNRNVLFQQLIRYKHAARSGGSGGSGGTGGGGGKMCTHAYCLPPLPAPLIDAFVIGEPLGRVSMEDIVRIDIERVEEREDEDANDGEDGTNAFFRTATSSSLDGSRRSRRAMRIANSEADSWFDYALLSQEEVYRRLQRYTSIRFVVRLPPSPGPYRGLYRYNEKSGEEGVRGVAASSSSSSPPPPAAKIHFSIAPRPALFLTADSPDAACSNYDAHLLASQSTSSSSASVKSGIMTPEGAFLALVLQVNPLAPSFDLTIDGLTAMRQQAIANGGGGGGFSTVSVAAASDGSVDLSLVASLFEGVSGALPLIPSSSSSSSSSGGEGDVQGLLTVKQQKRRFAAAEHHHQQEQQRLLDSKLDGNAENPNDGAIGMQSVSERFFIPLEGESGTNNTETTTPLSSSTDAPSTTPSSSSSNESALTTSVEASDAPPATTAIVLTTSPLTTTGDTPTTLSQTGSESETAVDTTLPSAMPSISTPAATTTETTTAATAPPTTTAPLPPSSTPPTTTTVTSTTAPPSSDPTRPPVVIDPNYLVNHYISAAVLGGTPLAIPSPTLEQCRLLLYYYLNLAVSGSSNAFPSSGVRGLSVGLSLPSYGELNTVLRRLTEEEADSTADGNAAAKIYVEDDDFITSTLRSVVEDGAIPLSSIAVSVAASVGALFSPAAAVHTAMISGVQKTILCQARDLAPPSSSSPASDDGEDAGDGFGVGLKGLSASYLVSSAFSNAVTMMESPLIPFFYSFGGVSGASSDAEGRAAEDRRFILERAAEAMASQQDAFIREAQRAGVPTSDLSVPPPSVRKLLWSVFATTALTSNMPVERPLNPNNLLYYRSGLIGNFIFFIMVGLGFLLFGKIFQCVRGRVGLFNKILRPNSYWRDVLTLLGWPTILWLPFAVIVHGTVALSVTIIHYYAVVMQYHAARVLFGGDGGGSGVSDSSTGVPQITRDLMEGLFFALELSSSGSSSSSSATNPTAGGSSAGVVPPQPPASSSAYDYSSSTAMAISPTSPWVSPPINPFERTVLQNDWSYTVGLGVGGVGGAVTGQSSSSSSGYDAANIYYSYNLANASLDLALAVIGLAFSLITVILVFVCVCNLRAADELVEVSESDDEAEDDEDARSKKNANKDVTKTSAYFEFDADAAAGGEGEDYFHSLQQRRRKLMGKTRKRQNPFVSFLCFCCCCCCSRSAPIVVESFEDEQRAKRKVLNRTKGVSNQSQMENNMKNAKNRYDPSSPFYVAPGVDDDPLPPVEITTANDPTGPNNEADKCISFPAITLVKVGDISKAAEAQAWASAKLIDLVATRDKCYSARREALEAAMDKARRAQEKSKGRAIKQIEVARAAVTAKTAARLANAERRAKKLEEREARRDAAKSKQNKKKKESKEGSGGKEKEEEERKDNSPEVALPPPPLLNQEGNDEAHTDEANTDKANADEAEGAAKAVTAASSGGVEKGADEKKDAADDSDTTDEDDDDDEQIYSTSSGTDEDGDDGASQPAGGGVDVSKPNASFDAEDQDRGNDADEDDDAAEEEDIFADLRAEDNPFAELFGSDIDDDDSLFGDIDDDEEDEKHEKEKAAEEDAFALEESAVLPDERKSEEGDNDDDYAFLKSSSDSDDFLKDSSGGEKNKDGAESRAAEARSAEKTMSTAAATKQKLTQTALLGKEKLNAANATISKMADTAKVRVEQTATSAHQHLSKSAKAAKAKARDAYIAASQKLSNASEAILSREETQRCLSYFKYWFAPESEWRMVPRNSATRRVGLKFSRLTEDCAAFERLADKAARDEVRKHMRDVLRTRLERIVEAQQEKTARLQSKKKKRTNNNVGDADDDDAEDDAELTAEAEALASHIIQDEARSAGSKNNGDFMKSKALAKVLEQLKSDDDDDGSDADDKDADEHHQEQRKRGKGSSGSTVAKNKKKGSEGSTTIEAKRLKRLAKKKAAEEAEAAKESLIPPPPLPADALSHILAFHQRRAHVLQEEFFYPHRHSGVTRWLLRHHHIVAHVRWRFYEPTLILIGGIGLGVLDGIIVTSVFVCQVRAFLMAALLFILLMITILLRVHLVRARHVLLVATVLFTFLASVMGIIIAFEPPANHAFGFRPEQVLALFGYCVTFAFVGCILLFVVAGVGMVFKLFALVVHTISLSRKRSALMEAREERRMEMLSSAAKRYVTMIRMLDEGENDDDDDAQRSGDDSEMKAFKTIKGRSSAKARRKKASSASPAASSSALLSSALFPAASGEGGGKHNTNIGIISRYYGAAAVEDKADFTSSDENDHAIIRTDFKIRQFYTEEARKQRLMILARRRRLREQRQKEKQLQEARLQQEEQQRREKKKREKDTGKKKKSEDSSGPSVLLLSSPPPLSPTEAAEAAADAAEEAKLLQKPHDEMLESVRTVGKILAGTDLCEVILPSVVTSNNVKGTSSPSSAAAAAMALGIPNNLTVTRINAYRSQATAQKQYLLGGGSRPLAHHHTVGDDPDAILYRYYTSGYADDNGDDAGANMDGSAAFANALQNLNRGGRRGGDADGGAEEEMRNLPPSPRKAKTLSDSDGDASFDDVLNFSNQEGFGAFVDFSPATRRSYHHHANNNNKDKDSISNVHGLNASSPMLLLAPSSTSATFFSNPAAANDGNKSMGKKGGAAAPSSSSSALFPANTILTVRDDADALALAAEEHHKLQRRAEKELMRKKKREEEEKAAALRNNKKDKKSHKSKDTPRNKDGHDADEDDIAIDADNGDGVVYTLNDLLKKCSTDISLAAAPPLPSSSSSRTALAKKHQRKESDGNNDGSGGEGDAIELSVFLPPPPPLLPQLNESVAAALISSPKSNKTAAAAALSATPSSSSSPLKTSMNAKQGKTINSKGEDHGRGATLGQLMSHAEEDAAQIHLPSSNGAKQEDKKEEDDDSHVPTAVAASKHQQQSSPTQQQQQQLPSAAQTREMVKALEEALKEKKEARKEAFLAQQQHQQTMLERMDQKGLGILRNDDYASLSPSRKGLRGVLMVSNSNDNNGANARNGEGSADSLEEDSD